MIYFDSRYLSSRLGIGISKWKRWAREFLPPDPLGGLQSGVARQFSLKDAFKVFLGGYLVGQMKFAIPDALQILTDLSPWLASNGFFSIQTHIRYDSNRKIEPHHIYIYSLQNKKFAYCVRTILSLQSIDNRIKQETSSRILISTGSDPVDEGHVKSAHVLAISVLYGGFLSAME